MKKYPDSTCVHWRPVMWLRHRHWPFCMEQLQRRRAELMIIAILLQLQLRSQVFIALKKKKTSSNRDKNCWNAPFEKLLRQKHRINSKHCQHVYLKKLVFDRFLVSRCDCVMIPNGIVGATHTLSTAPPTSHSQPLQPFTSWLRAQCSGCKQRREQS